MKVEVSNGELIDKYTILLIKQENIHDSGKQKNILRELKELESLVMSLDVPVYLIENLLETNKKLWNIEENIRIQEKNQDFGSTFIELARSVYITNTERFKYKTEINNLTNSLIVEEKSH
jgi:hypothetical protein